MLYSQNPHDPFIRKAALLQLILVILGSVFVTLLHQLEPGSHPINSVIPPIIAIVHFILLLYLYRNPSSLILVLWIGTITILGAVVIIVCYFTLQAAFLENVKIIETLPPINSLPLAVIVTMFIFARPNQVLITAIVSWLFIAFPVLGYLVLHPNELFTPRGLEMTFTLLPIIASILIFIPVYKGIEEKMISLKNERTQMQTLSEHDPLTQVYNRRGLETLFSELIITNNSNIGVILFDIDHFKKINDEFGHDVGDSVLCQIVQCSRAILRKDDIFTRWGGEEFLILIPSAGNEVILKIAEKLRIVISNLSIKPAGKVTASFGATIFYPTDSLESLVQRVDQAMYLAKKQGRNRVCSLFNSI